MIVDETAHRLLMENLQSMVKPRNVLVMEVSRQAQVLCMYSDDLPMESGALPVATNYRRRKEDPLL